MTLKVIYLSSQKSINSRMHRIPVAKQIIRLCATSQEAGKACISWHYHIGCYTKIKNNEKLKLKLYESWRCKNPLSIMNPLRVVNRSRYMNLLIFMRLSRSFHRFIPIHESEKNPNTRVYHHFSEPL